MGRPSRGGEFDFCLGGVGWAKLNRSVRFQVIFFLCDEGANKNKHMKHL